MVETIRASVQNGEMTERRLARLTGVSQPHIHHVLHGKRGFSMETADRVMRTLRMDLLDFLGPADIAEWKSRIQLVVE